MKFFKRLAAVPEENRILLLATVFLLGLPGFSLISSLLARLSFPTKIWTIVYYGGILFPLFLYSIKGILRKICIIDIVFFTIFVLLLALTYFFVPTSRFIIIDSIPGIVDACIPFYFLMRVFPFNNEKAQNHLRFVSAVCIPMALANSILEYLGSKSSIRAMTEPYVILFFASMCVFFIFSHSSVFKKIKFLFAPEG